jgi:hypothetical protein
MQHWEPLTQQEDSNTATLAIALLSGPVNVLVAEQLGCVALPKGLPHVPRTLTDFESTSFAGLPSVLVSWTELTFEPGVSARTV